MNENAHTAVTPVARQARKKAALAPARLNGSCAGPWFWSSSGLRLMLSQATGPRGRSTTKSPKSCCP